MLLSVLARKYELIIDRAVDAPGHGNGVVDGIQGSEKNFIRRKMCMTNKNGIDSQEDRMEAAQISDDTPTSFAKECIRLCSAESRKMNVITHKKNKKREESRKILAKFYHYQEYDPSQEVQIEKEAKGFDKGTRCGIMSHYNF